MLLTLLTILLFGFYEATGQEQEIIFDGSKYELFTKDITQGGISWQAADESCLNMGRNLATISSKQIDSLLYYLPTHEYSCWIGLFDIFTEAGNKSSAFIWANGNESTYRQFGTTDGAKPDDTDGTEDCVIFRYNGSVLSDGWDDRSCDDLQDCYFCQKLSDSRGCDLIYEGSCYRAFEVSDGITWLDTQSSCAVWGGDLTSITTERENNLLYTAISDTVSNSWIGLYERDGDGMYHWVDGTIMNYTNWAGNMNITTTNNCVIMNFDGYWTTMECDEKINSFICKTNSTEISPENIFGELTEEGLNFRSLVGDIFLYNSTTLVCKGGTHSNAITWLYSVNSNLSASEVLTATYLSTEIGVSWLSVNTSKQGYYQCQIDSTNINTVGVYNSQEITVASDATTYQYMVGLDREDTLLLCDPRNSSYALDSLSWRVMNSIFNNPVNIFSTKDKLNASSNEFECISNNDALLSSNILIIVPHITVTYKSSLPLNFNTTYPEVNILPIEIGSKYFSMSVNTVGRWKRPDGSYVNASTVSFLQLFYEYFGVYQFYANNWDGNEVCVMQINIVIKVTGEAQKILFHDSVYVLFTRIAYMPGTINWMDAQTSCVAWGGNLSTIDSKQVDSLLLVLLPTIEYQHYCWIGLNDLQNEAGTNASAFVWVDGSNSTYRHFGTLRFQRPSNNESTYDCVSFRYDYDDELSDGWFDRPCNHYAYCYFCQKPGDSRGCDLIYEGYCYRAFEVSDGINWLDAQSSCAVWGGDLTSITTERENNLLYTAISDTVSNCWIGLYERDGDGMYQWVDGTPLNYTNWPENLTNITTNACVMMNSSGFWTIMDCDEQQSSFICRSKLPEISQGNIFGELTEEGVNFRSLMRDIFLYNSTTLVCKGGTHSNAITWLYSVNSNLSASEVLTATYMSTETGVSWLSVNNSKQGYYQCQIDSTNINTVGVYNSQEITVASDATTYQYIVGLDREDTLLLCDPRNSSYALDSLSWRVMNSIFNNPVNIFSTKDKLTALSNGFECISYNNAILSSNILLIVPQITIRYTPSLPLNFNKTYPGMNILPVEIGSKFFSLSVNTVGRWKRPDGSYVNASTVSFLQLFYEYFGVYQFYANNWDGVEVCVMQINIVIKVTGEAQKILFHDSVYVLFTRQAYTPDTIGWMDAQTSCVAWGGNLSTIDSEQVDSLFLVLLPTIYYQKLCWIGLNDLQNEAGTNASAFVWVDGSNSTYRNFGTSGYQRPSNNESTYDCVSFRYDYYDRLSDGWFDRPCNHYSYCYFCQKPGDSRGCDLIYEGSCYRAFEVSDGINWLDAQSSCAVWGGDLTSITTERENNLLYTAISDTVSNSWIGLYERDGDGMYHWVDGTLLDYTNWAENLTNITTNACVMMNSSGFWTIMDCDQERNSYICKRKFTEIYPVNIFGRLTDGGLTFDPFIRDTFLYNISTKLACMNTENSDAITWQYSSNADLSTSEEITPTYLSTETGVSWISVDNSKQGYYHCQIDNTNRYTVGIYNTELTTVASQGISYQYIVGVDRDNILLLCDPMNSSYKLESLSWRLMDGNTFSNPLNVTDQRDRLPHVQTAFTCFSDMITILSSYIRIYVPEITITYMPSITQRIYTVYPAMNTITVEIGTEDFNISVGNMLGRWKLPNGIYISSSTVSYPILLYEYFGIYQFYLDNWDGDEVCVIQISILLGGYSMINSITLSNSETIQNGSTIVTTEDTTLINCVISDPEYIVEWIYRSPLDVETDVTEFSTFSTRTGVSALNISSQQPGYYSCVINAALILSFYIADRDTLVIIQNFDSPDQQVNYTADDTSSMLYYSHANIPDISVRWTTDTVTDGADTQYSIEYPNPVLLSRVFSDVGGGVHTLSCFYRMSPVSLVGSIMLIIRDTATISISYGGYNDTFSDTNNPMFPSPQQISIPKGTGDVLFSCNLTECVWLVQLKNTTFITSMSHYTFPTFGLENEGNYSLILQTILGFNFTTAHVFIHMTPDITQTPLSTIIAPILTITLVIFVIILTSSILIVIFIRNFIRKKNIFDGIGADQIPLPDAGELLLIESQDQIRPIFEHDPHLLKGNNTIEHDSIFIARPNKEFADIFTNKNPEYMSIEETSLIPVESDIKMEKAERSYYDHIAMDPICEDNYDQIKEKKQYSNISHCERYENLTPMTVHREDRKFFAKYIPAKDFTATYQQYVASGMGNDSLFLVEFKALNEETKKNVEPESYEARRKQNMRKNSVNTALPYDENRVVLESPYFECNYINASWLENSQFIASIHPTQNTLQDFLQMIYQTEASMVIMLSTRKEKAKIISGVSNRVCYWPKKDEILKCDPFETSLTSSTETNAFIKQEISLKHTLDGKSHSFIHCLSPIWNEDGTIVELNFVVSLLSRVIKQKQDYPHKPIIIHCEDGISKTGVFLTVFNVIKELNLRKSINIFNAVKNLFRQRMSMVPTLACYTTCYSLMNEYCSIQL